MQIENTIFCVKYFHILTFLLHKNQIILNCILVYKIIQLDTKLDSLPMSLHT